jgi:hypothetical protein
MTRITVWLAPEVHRQLKILAAKHGRRIGDVIAGLFRFSQADVEGYCRAIGIDPQAWELIAGVMEQLFTDSMERFGQPDDEWTPDLAAIRAEEERRASEE